MHFVKVFLVFSGLYGNIHLYTPSRRKESRDLVEYLRSQGKQVEYLMFPNEGHDVLKFENRVTCYNTITEFFQKYLQP